MSILLKKILSLRVLFLPSSSHSPQFLSILFLTEVSHFFQYQLQVIFSKTLICIAVISNSQAEVKCQWGTVVGRVNTLLYFFFKFLFF